jgi:hypothetical protein
LGGCLSHWWARCCGAWRQMRLLGSSTSSSMGSPMWVKRRTSRACRLPANEHPNLLAHAALVRAMASVMAGFTCRATDAAPTRLEAARLRQPCGAWQDVAPLRPCQRCAYVAALAWSA